MNSEKLILPEYPGEYTFIVGSAPEGQVRLAVSHSVLMGNENYKNFPLNSTISQFKQKLQLTVGTDPIFMKLELKDKGITLATLDDDNALLSSYKPQNGMEIHVIDTDPKATIAALTDASNAEKYVMSDEKYHQREDTVLKHKEQELQRKFAIGEECRVLSEDNKSKNAKVAYVGGIEGAKGVWVGVILDEPSGKNDGSAKGKRYFTCEPNHGLFVRAEKVIPKSAVKESKQEQKDDEI